MSAPPLTIRNLTSTPFELKVVERHLAPSTLEPRGFASNFTSFLGNTTSVPLTSKLPDNAQSHARHDVSTRIEPFCDNATDIKTTERSPNEVLRLVFEVERHRYRIDTPTASDASQVLVPLSPEAKGQYTGVFIPSTSCLAIYSSTNLQSWMQYLDDRTPISALSIPGTHNSPTCHKALPSVRCQSVSPKTQLNNGIRFFDIRVQPESPSDPSKDALILVHGVFPISLTGRMYFRPLLADILAFLASNPSETVIISLKREGTGNSTDAQLSQILHDHYTSRDPQSWYTDPAIPQLGQVRGKLVLLRRFALAPPLKAMHDGRGWALDAENWAYNTAHDTHGSVCVQDFCEVLETVNIEHKVKVCCEHFERAAKATAPVPGVNTDEANPVPAGPLYLNFLSASNFWRVGCWPERIAARLNPAVVRFLCTEHELGMGGEGGGGQGDGALGVVVCDWVGKGGDWDLVRCIVGMNARLEMRQRMMLGQ